MNYFRTNLMVGLCSCTNTPKTASVSNLPPNTTKKRIVGTAICVVLSERWYEWEKLIFFAFSHFGIKLTSVVTKHHDGFCQWATRNTKHTVRKVT